MDLDAITLPAHTHAAGLWPDPAPPAGTAPDHIVIWADRPYRACTVCAQPVPRNPGCPAVISEGEIAELPQQHTCGTALPVTWMGIPPDPDTGEFGKRDLRRGAAQIASEWRQQARAVREYLRGELLRDLGVSLSQLAGPYDPDLGETYESRAVDFITGSDTTPGIWHNGTEWCAWTWDPGSDDNDVRIIVTGPDVADHWKQTAAEIAQ